MKQIKIACVNDFHAALQQTEAVPGCARFLTALRHWKQANPESLIVFGGDNYLGDPTSEYAGGTPVTTLMRELDVKASALGNHELDFPAEQLRRWQQEGDYPFVCANIADENGNSPDFAVPYVILTTGGKRIAFLGLATKEPLNTSTHPAEIRKLVISDPAKAANDWCAWLRAGKAPEGTPDAILALTHIGLRFEPDGTPAGEEMCALCSSTAGLDGAFAAHWHQLMATHIAGIPVAQGGSHGQGFAVLTLCFADSGKLERVESSYVSLENPADWPEADAEMSRIYQNAHAVAMEKLSTKLAYAPTEIVHRNPDTHEPPYAGSPLSQMMLEAMARRADAPIALLYSGWLGNGLPQGEVKKYDVSKNLYFNGNIVSMRVSGAVLMRNLSLGIRNLRTDNKSPIAVLGLHLVIDPSRPLGQRLQSASNDEGQAIDPEKTYAIVIDGGMAEGMMGFDFSEGTQKIYFEDTLLELMEKELQSRGTLILPQPSNITVLQEGAAWK